MAKKVLMYTLSPVYEGRHLTGLTLFATDEDAQTEWVADCQVAPFDTSLELGVWLSKALFKRETLARM